MKEAKMRIKKALQLGIKKTWQEKKLIFLLWAINAFFSFIFTLPFYFLLKDNFSRSLLTSNLTRGFDLIWLSDLIYRYQNLIPYVVGLAISTVLLWVPISLGLTGGIMGRLHSVNSFRWTEFMSAAGYYFFRFLKVFFLFILSLIIILMPLSRLLNSLFHLWTESATSAWPAFWSGIIKLLLLLAIYSLVRLFFDYTRILLVLEDNRKVLKGVGRGGSFLAPRLVPAWAVFLLASLFPVILTIAYLLFLRLTPTTSLPTFWLIFFLGQIYLLLRQAGKVFTLGSCYYFARLEKGEPTT